MSFCASDALIANNILTGRIRNRDRGRSDHLRNLISPLSPWFWQPGPRQWFTDADNVDFKLQDPLEIKARGIGAIEGTVDFCGHPRPQTSTDLGAIEYSNGASCDLRSLFGH